MSVRKAIRLAQFSHGGWYCKSKAGDQSALRLRIREIAHARPRFGYLRIHVMLRREGWRVNKKRIHRWYRLEGLQIRMQLINQPLAALASLDTRHTAAQLRHTKSVFGTFLAHRWLDTREPCGPIVNSTDP